MTFGETPTTKEKSTAEHAEAKIGDIVIVTAKGFIDGQELQNKAGILGKIIDFEDGNSLGNTRIQLLEGWSVGQNSLMDDEDWRLATEDEKNNLDQEKE